METGERLEHDEGWERVRRLIELAKSEQEETFSPERKQRLRDNLLRRLEQDRIQRLERQRMRRRIAGGFVAGASTMLLVGLLLRLVGGGGLPWRGSPSAELARQHHAPHSIVE